VRPENSHSEGVTMFIGSAHPSVTSVGGRVGPRHGAMTRPMVASGPPSWRPSRCLHVGAVSYAPDLGPVKEENP